MLSGLTRLLTTQLLAVVGSALGVSVVKLAAADSEAMSWDRAETPSPVDGHPFTVSHMTQASKLCFRVLYLLGQNVTLTPVAFEKAP